MKTFILSTDFSDNALNAIRYACTLNKKLNAKLVLFHSYVVPVYSTDIPLTIPQDKELRDASEKALNQLRDKLRKEFPDMEIEADLNQGYPEEEIVFAADKHKADMIIMGTKGASGLREALVGTISAAVMEYANCPVMAVPADCNYKDFKKIVFATNYAEGDFHYVEQVLDFARPFGADLILIHISSGEFERSLEFDAIERFKERIKEDSKYKNVHFKLLESKNVYEGLNNYLDEVQADLVAMTMRKRSFIQKLFKRSITQKMAYHTHIPLIAFKVPE
ncbi:MAG TPA: universal stress protein [Bacteroidia bacterium]|nr:universal stress protein [Bacteroidia bacterium]